MDEGALKRIVILFFLLYQASTGVWFEFKADSSASIDDVEFYIDKIESSSSFIDSNSYGSFNDLEDKMDFHNGLITWSLFFCILLAGIILFNNTTLYYAKLSCFAIAILSFTNAIMFTNFPLILEVEMSFFTTYAGMTDNPSIFFMQDYLSTESLSSSWGPKFAWWSSIAIIPLYALYLLNYIATMAEPTRRKTKKSANTFQNSPVSSIGIQVPDSQFSLNKPLTISYQKSSSEIEVISQSGEFSDKAPSLSSPITEIKFSKPELKETFNPKYTLKGENDSYLIEGLIMYSGCSEILFGNRITDGRMVVIKKPYGYRNQNQKGKNGMVNTYASALKQIENEHAFLDTMMNHNKSNFPELLDWFEHTLDRRKTQYMVTKYFSPSLKKYVNFHSTKKGGLNYKRGIELFVKISNSVKIIHEKLGYAWADLKSENILMENNNPILIDFGTSIIPSTSKAKIKIDSGGWSAPETIKGNPTFASDIYSLGKLLVYILTEIRPKQKQKPNVFKAQISHEFKKRNIDIDLVKIIMKSTNEKIEDRYSCIDDILADLQEKSLEETICNNCDQKLIGQVKFCKSCGYKTTKKKVVKTVMKKTENSCKSCKKVLDSDSIFCKYCGKSVTPQDSEIKGKYNVGDKIAHDLFGSGTIHNRQLIDSYALEIDFDDGEKRSLSSSHIQLLDGTDNSKPVKTVKSKKDKRGK